MRKLCVETFLKLQQRWTDESGQDLVEYALIVALIAFAATAGMGSLASSINGAFSNMASLMSIA